MTDLMGDPAVNAEMERLGTYIDRPKWDAFVAEVKP